MTAQADPPHALMIFLVFDVPGTAEQSVADARNDDGDIHGARFAVALGNHPGEPLR